MVEEVGALIGLSYLAQDMVVTKLKAIDIIKTAARAAGKHARRLIDLFSRLALFIR